ncbi:MAG TPA: hypothetical protein VK668_21385 [Mucilaginibacter sp.]|nr:hypothetical protein [Mucilaginibacter sp.]
MKLYPVLHKIAPVIAAILLMLSHHPKAAASAQIIDLQNLHQPVNTDHSLIKKNNSHEKNIHSRCNAAYRSTCLYQPGASAAYFTSRRG